MCLQRFGTGPMGAFFGPVILLWLLSLGLIGCYNISDAPRIAQALNPAYAVEFFFNHGPRSFQMLGFVVLSVTGA